MYKILVDKLPVGTNASRGQQIASLIQMDNNEKVIAATSLDRDIDAKYVVFITKQGLVKKSELTEYTSIKKSTGTQAIKLKDDDTIVNILFMKEEDLVLFTKQGMTIRFTTGDINSIGRVTSGVKGIKLNENDEVIAGIPIINNKATIAIIDINGYGKRCELSEFPNQGRGGKGLKTGHELAGAELVTDEDNLLLVGKPNSICISATEMTKLGRNALGTKLAKNIINKVVKL
jgi:DNA gyrase subunit A